MKRRGSLLGKLAVLAALTVAASGCLMPEADSAWQAQPTELPEGPKVGALDAASGDLWILVAPNPYPTEPALVTRYSADDGQVARHTISGSTAGMAVGAGLAVAADGTVWMAWGSRLISLDPGSGVVDEYAIPVSTGAGFLVGTAGTAVSLAIDHGGRIAVAVTGNQSLEVFDPVERAWSALGMGEFYVYSFSEVAVLEGGGYAVNGVLFESASEMDARTVRVAPDGSSRVLEGVDSWRMAAGGGDPVLFGSDGKVTRLDVAADRAQLVQTVDGIGAPGRFGNAADGASWFWRWDGRELLVSRIGVSGETDEYEFPLVEIVFGPGERRPDPRGGPDPFADGTARIDPVLQQVLPDGDGGAWVLTRFAGEGEGAYTALYRLIP